MAITLEEAQALMCRYAKRTGKELEPLESCIGRILAEDLTARMEQPPFPRSAMDGYAVRSEDTLTASQAHPVQLKVVGKVCAGDGADLRIREGETVRIMTGGIIPEGADSVIRQEDTDSGEDKVMICKKAFPQLNYCEKGEDFHKGEILARKGERVDAYMLAAAAASGITRLCVFRKVRAAIVTTGDELCPLEEKLGRGKIYDSHTTYLRARLLQLGCEVSGSFMAGDRSEEIGRAICQAMENTDLIITTGGVSAGQKDLLPEVIRQLKGEILFHHISVKPGMPTMFSRWMGTPILSLSGNPYAAFAMFELLAQPFIAAALGDKSGILPVRTARMGSDYEKQSLTRRMLRGIYDGRNVMVPKRQSNGRLKTGIGSNCFVDVPAGTKRLRAGDQVKVILMDAGSGGSG